MRHFIKQIAPLKNDSQLFLMKLKTVTGASYQVMQAFVSTARVRNGNLAGNYDRFLSLQLRENQCD